MAVATAGVGKSAGGSASFTCARLLASARVRFAAGGLAVALVLAVAAWLLARWSPLGAEVATFLVGAALLVGIGVRIGRRVDALERTSREDPMTCVGNRRHWEASLRKEVDRALRSRMPLSVLMVDLDNLKHLNDAHGHGCGDRALALVGEVLRDTCRSRDVAARFGGDEFAAPASSHARLGGHGRRRAHPFRARAEARLARCAARFTRVRLHRCCRSRRGSRCRPLVRCGDCGLALRVCRSRSLHGEVARTRSRREPRRFRASRA